MKCREVTSEVVWIYGPTRMRLIISVPLRAMGLLGSVSPRLDLCHHKENVNCRMSTFRGYHSLLCILHSGMCTTPFVCVPSTR